MSRWYLAAAFSLLILIAVQVMKPERTPKFNMYRKLPDTGIHFMVRLHERDSGRFFCSGSVISDRYIVTAAHCVSMRSSTFSDIEIRSDAGEKLNVYARLVKYNSQGDTALISGHFEKFSHVPVLTDPRELIITYNTPGRFIIACGFPYGGAPFCTQFLYVGPYMFQFQGMGFLYPGMSGGPVFDGLTGTLIGVNAAVYGSTIIVSPTIELFRSMEIEVEE